MAKMKTDIQEPSAFKLAEYLANYCEEIRVAPTAMFEKCGIQRSEWTRLKKGKPLSINQLRKIALGISMPLGLLLVISGFLSEVEVANINSAAVQNELTLVQNPNDTRQIWRLTREESEIMRYYRFLEHPEARATIRQTLRGFVRLTSHINMTMPYEISEQLNEIEVETDDNFN